MASKRSNNWSKKMNHASQDSRTIRNRNQQHLTLMTWTLSRRVFPCLSEDGNEAKKLVHFCSRFPRCHYPSTISCHGWRWSMNQIRKCRNKNCGHRKNCFSSETRRRELVSKMKRLLIKTWHPWSTKCDCQLQGVGMIWYFELLSWWQSRVLIKMFWSVQMSEKPWPSSRRTWNRIPSHTVEAHDWYVRQWVGCWMLPWMTLPWEFNPSLHVVSKNLQGIQGNKRLKDFIVALDAFEVDLFLRCDTCAVLVFVLVSLGRENPATCRLAWPLDRSLNFWDCHGHVAPTAMMCRSSEEVSMRCSSVWIAAGAWWYWIFGYVYSIYSRGGALIQMDHILSSRPFHPVTTMWFFIPHWFGQSFCTLQIEKHGWQGYWTTSVAPKTGSPDAPSALHSRLLISDPAFSADSQKTVLTRPGSMVVRRAICCVLFHFNISNACGHGQLLSLQIWPCQKKMHRSHNAERCTIPHFVSRDAERCRSPRKKWFYLFCKQFQNQWKRYCRERSLHNHVGPDKRWRIQCDVWDVTNLEMNLGWQPKC